MRRYLGLISIFIVVLVGLTGCSSDENEGPLDDGVLTVGMEADYAPYNWTATAGNVSDYGVELSDGSGYADGYDVRISSAIADYLGVELEIKKMSWDGLIPALQSGSIDMIVAGMSPTEERSQQINFTDAYFENSPEQVIVVSKDSPYANATTFADLTGANLTAQMGTFQVDLLSQIDIADDATAPLPDYASLIQATVAGTTDGYIAEKAVADTQVKGNDNLIELQMSEEFVMDESMTTTAIGVAKENTELVNQINEALATINQETRNQWMQEASEASGVEV